MEASYDPRVLGAAIRAARKALRDLDEDQILASLRRVAASTARHLPPPLARSLLRDLDRFVWLRDKAAEAWPAITEAVGDDAASAAFLLRSEGWEQVVEAAVAARSHRDLIDSLEGLEARTRDLEHQLEVERGRADKARADTVEAERRARCQSNGISRKVQEARLAERVGRLAAESRVAALERSLEQAIGDLAEADGRVAFLREELLRTRRASGTSVATHGPDVWSVRDPAALASLLDQIVASAQADPAPAQTTEVESSSPLILPAGVRPDSAVAIEWLLGQQEPFVMIVDGYNLSHQWPDPLGREDINYRLARVRRLAVAPVRLLVIYDSTLPGGGESGPGPGGIEVRFTDGGTIADEEIIRLSGAIEGNVVVVSSDREVREGCPRALCLWGQALKEWLG
ncbi:MAG: hypothetical protein GWP04_06250 [Gammaproteobacteria bacterium]|nr:hypothetical protein [Gammaproteobacteria bacterium]